MVVEQFRVLHHRRMATFFQHDKLGVLDSLVEFLADEGGGHLVVFAPDEKGGGGDSLQAFPQVVADGRFGGRHHSNGFVAVVDSVEDFVHEFFGRCSRIVKSILRFFLDIVVVAPLREGGAHRTFEEAGTAREGDGGDALRVRQGVEQGDVAAEGIAEHVYFGVAFFLDEGRDMVHQTRNTELAERHVENGEDGHDHVVALAEMLEDGGKIAQSAKQTVQQEQVLLPAFGFNIFEAAFLGDRIVHLAFELLANAAKIVFLKTNGQFVFQAATLSKCAR